MPLSQTELCRVDDLMRQHKELDARLRDEQDRPGRDDAEIRRLKVEKLRIKDEVNKLLICA